MQNLQLNFHKKNIFNEVIEARDRGNDFSILVEGEMAEKLNEVLPFYENYKNRNLNSKKSKSSIISFGIRAITHPLFWCLCILVEFKSNQAIFEHSTKSLIVHFKF